MARTFVPLRNIPISIVADDVVVHGEVEWLLPTDMRVVVTAALAPPSSDPRLFGS